MLRGEDLGDLITGVAALIVFVVLPLIVKALKGKQPEQANKPIPTPADAPEERKIPAPKSEFDVFVEAAKRLKKKKEEPRPKPKTEPIVSRTLPEIVPVTSEKMLPNFYEVPVKQEKVESRRPVTEIVEGLPDLAQVIVLAEIIGKPKALVRHNRYYTGCRAV